MIVTIHFKNGTKKEISQDIAETLNNNIVQGCKRFQMFIDENDKLFLFINVNEIVFID